MSALARDAAKFNSALQRQDFSTWHSTNTSGRGSSPSSSADAPSPAPSLTVETKKKRPPKSNIVYSQPADTGTGTLSNTQLVYAVDFLKNNSNGNPMRLDDIAIHINVPGLISDQSLVAKFRAHDRVIHDPKTDLYSYRSDFSFRNKASLLTEIQRHTKLGGLSVRALKDSWKEAPQAIEELEQEGEVLITRTNKDGQMKMVFWNEVKPADGGDAVEKEFHDLWHSLRVPEEADLVKLLHSEGLQATAAESIIPKLPQGKKKGKKGAPRQRQARITNTHLNLDIDLSKDYMPSI